MTAGDGIEHLTEPPQRAAAVYRSPVLRPRPAGNEDNGRLAVGGGRLAQRAEHFASAVRFGLDRPDAMRRLHDLTKDLRTVSRLSSLLPQVLADALALKRCAQTVVADVRSDPGFAPHREIAAAGFRAVQSTPLTHYAGRCSRCRRAAHSVDSR